MNGPNDRPDNRDQEREKTTGMQVPDSSQEGDAARIEAESTLSRRDQEALLPDIVVEGDKDQAGRAPRSNAGDVERGTGDDTDTGSDTPEGPIVLE